MVKYLKNFRVSVIVSGFLVLMISSASATVSFVKPQDASQKVSVATKSTIPSYVTSREKARAPEPSTLALFGSGFLGIIISFLRRTYALVKRIFDLTISVLSLIVLSPLLLMTALLIKLTSKGPIVYTQTRVGLDGQHFNIYKFRTMRVDAEKETGPVWAIKNDSRLTPIGGILRKSRIDEIPQFINVLKGDMSIIGPRPERPVFVNKFSEIIPDYSKRLAVKPGITGLAQVWHRYDENIDDVKKKVKYDILYIKKMCFIADIRIVLRTIRVVLTGFGAQ